MLDPEVEYVLGVLGYVVASHVMARASLGRRSGAYEETLTADLRDLFELYDVANAYLGSVGSASRMQVKVTDLAKLDESRLGADFVLVMRGQDDDGAGNRREVRKVVLVQAKRQDFTATSLKYAASSNHVEKAKSMVRAVGLANSYFAFYHSDTVIKSAPAVSWLPPPHGRPALFYLFPARPAQNQLFVQHHPYRHHSAFLEVSGYRSLTLMQKGTMTLDGYEWGVALIDASYFVNASGNPNNTTLPTVTHVLSNGSHLPSFLLGLAKCTLAENLPDDRTLRQRLKAALGLSTLGGDASPEFNPSFMVAIEFASSRGQAESEWEFLSDLSPEPLPRE